MNEGIVKIRLEITGSPAAIRRAITDMENSGLEVRSKVLEVRNTPENPLVEEVRRKLEEAKK